MKFNKTVESDTNINEAIQNNMKMNKPIHTKINEIVENDFVNH